MQEASDTVGCHENDINISLYLMAHKSYNCHIETHLQYLKQLHEGSNHTSRTVLPAPQVSRTVHSNADMLTEQTFEATVVVI